MNYQKILGDYQTPLPLARQVVSLLFSKQRSWERVLEPTCGVGNFIRACLEHSQDIREVIGLEIQRQHVEAAMRIHSDSTSVSVIQQDIFEIDIAGALPWKSDSPLLIVGNPPWVTNAELGRLNGSNLPHKSNYHKLSGLDAITGKSNFDIAEAIWLKLLGQLQSEPVTIALLCKTTVARKVAQYLLQQNLPVNHMSLYHINAQKWFDAAVDAGLFVVQLNQGDDRCDGVEVYDSLKCAQPAKTMGIVNQQIVADIRSYRDVAFVDGESSLQWRQGVKHDASKVMELTLRNGSYRNGYGSVVDIESEYIYPLLKSSDITSIGPGFAPRKYVIVTQRKLGQKTIYLQDHAPKLWEYLNSHADKLDARKSSIYKKASRFAMFGIGDYSFAPSKVVVSGFYLPAKFVAVARYDGKEVLLDDTCYFIPFYDERQASFVASLLNHSAVDTFLKCVVFPDSKRPITKRVLQRIDIDAVYESARNDQLCDYCENDAPVDIAAFGNRLTSNQLQLL